MSSSEEEEKEVSESRRETGSIWAVGEGGVAAGDGDGKEPRGRGTVNVGGGTREGVAAGDGDWKEERGVLWILVVTDENGHFKSVTVDLGGLL